MPTTRSIITLLCLLFTVTTRAHEHGAQWAIGPDISILDFRNDTIATYPISEWMNMHLTSASYCNSNGELLYYTNGIFIADKNGVQLNNGNGLSPCNFTTQYAIHGLPIQQAAIFLPNPAQPGKTLLFHLSGDSSGSRPGTLYYSVIDGESNFGLGAVIDKNHVFHKEIYRAGGMTACKHANGRDWWIVIGADNRNRFYTFLLTPDGITDTLTQDIGPIYYGPFDNAYSCFSEDGSKYITGVYVGLITVMDLDRCTGMFSNPITIDNRAEGFNSAGISSIAFSPNGRYVYAATRVDLKQYDLTNTNIQDSVVLYRTDSGDYAEMHFLELGPNGKLYGSTWNGGYKFLHVINKPDEKGDSCEFVFGGQPTLSANSFNLPNMPNYKLGALVGSACDTIVTSTPKSPKGDLNSQIRIQPNPANKYMYIEMPMQGNYVFELMNDTGQIVERRQTKQVDIINTENLPAGIYFLQVTGSANTKQRVVVQH